LREANKVKVEVEDEVEDNLDVATERVVQILPEAVTRKERLQQEDMGEDTQTQGMTNLKLNATIVRSLGTTLQSVDSPRIEYRRRPTM